MSKALTPKALARWRADPAAFIERHLVDPESGRPFKLLPAERAFLKHALATDADSRLRYPELLYGAPKKSGKTGFAAIFMLTLLLLYGGRFAEGYAAANDLEQAQGRVFEMVRRIVEASPLLRSEAKVGADRVAFTPPVLPSRRSRPTTPRPSAAIRVWPCSMNSGATAASAHGGSTTSLCPSRRGKSVAAWW
jgi:hypothetical protein